MKKKLLLFIFFLISLFVQGQSEYAILIKSKITSPSVWPGNDYNGLHQITAGVNSCSIYFFEEDYKEDKYCFFYVTGNPTELRFTEILGGSPTCGQITRTIPYNKETFSYSYFAGCLANAEIMSLHIKQPNTSPKCNEDPITLENGWNWQYKLDNGEWNDFPPQFQEQRSITFKINDLPLYNNQSTVFFKTGYNKQFTNAITYSIIPCSPRLDHTSNQNFTTCSYSNGSVVFTFSRPLETEKGEKFFFNRNLVGSTFITSANSNEPEIEKVSALSYKWKNIPAGEYEFKYQTQFGNNTPSTMSAVTKFTITQSRALTFTATAVQPVCSTDPKGILITATGGSNSYYYLLNDEPLAQKHAFTSPHTIKITTDGAHKVIVVDDSDCIEK